MDVTATCSEEGCDCYTNIVIKFLTLYATCIVISAPFLCEADMRAKIGEFCVHDVIDFKFHIGMHNGNTIDMDVVSFKTICRR